MLPEQKTVATDVLESSASFRVRYSECDPMGYVHHSNHVVYFELARLELLRKWGITHAELERLGAPLVVTQLEIKYKRAGKYDEILTSTARLLRWTAVRITIDQTIHRDGLVLCEGQITLACVRPDGRPQRFPPELRQVLDSVPHIQA